MAWTGAKPLGESMKAKTVYDSFRALLKGLPTVSTPGSPALRIPLTDGIIDEICDDAIELLQCWDDFFSLLARAKPTENDLSNAHKIAEKAVAKHREMMGKLTPKGHLCEDHAINQFLSLPPGLFRLLIEEWVEHNHQIGSRVETRYRNQQDIDLRANSIAMSIHQMQLPEVKQRIKDVNKPRVVWAYRKRGVPPASQDSPERQQQDLHSRTSS